MRIRTGHKPEDWSENTPSSVISHTVRGAMVVGGPGSWEVRQKTKVAQAAAKRAKRAEEKAA